MPTWHSTVYLMVLALMAEGEYPTGLALTWPWTIAMATQWPQLRSSSLPHNCVPWPQGKGSARTSNDDGRPTMSGLEPLH